MRNAVVVYPETKHAHDAARASCCYNSAAEILRTDHVRSSVHSASGMQLRYDRPVRRFQSTCVDATECRLRRRFSRAQRDAPDLRPAPRDTRGRCTTTAGARLLQPKPMECRLQCCTLTFTSACRVSWPWRRRCRGQLGDAAHQRSCAMRAPDKPLAAAKRRERQLQHAQPGRRCSERMRNEANRIANFRLELSVVRLM